MKILSHSAFLSDLTNRLKNIHAQGQTQFSNLSVEAINHSPGPGAWSIAQCLEHLNRYARFYVPEMETEIKKSLAKGIGPISQVEYGFLGKQSINAIAPNSSRKMKTKKHLNPVNEEFGVEVVTEFLSNQEKYLQVVTQAQKASLNKVKVRIEVMRMLKLRLGACLEFLVLHEERHLQQALNILPLIGEKAKVKAS